MEQNSTKNQHKTDEEIQESEDSDASTGQDQPDVPIKPTIKPKKKSKNPIWEEEPTEEKPVLTKRQELFCKLFAQDRECFGVGVRAYLGAYPKCGYESAKSNAYRLLTNDYIIKRIDQLMEVFMSDQVADKELNRVILQHGNLNAKVRAINERNKVRGRIIDKSDLTSGGKSLNVIPIYGGQSIKSTISDDNGGGVGEQSESVQGHDSNEKDISTAEKN